MYTIDKTTLSKDTIARLNNLQSSRFTGRLSILEDDRLKWIIYFRLGRIIWVTGGVNSCERWQRNLTLFCSELSEKQLQQIHTQHKLDKEYEILAQLYQREYSGKKQKLVDLVESTVNEVLFDVIQYDALYDDRLSYKIIPNKTPSYFFTLIDTETAIEQAIQSWQKWVNAGLKTYSPNLYPVIDKRKILEQLLPPQKYQLIVSLIDGTQTLRTLAAKTDRDIVTFTKSTSALVDRGALAFSPTPILRKIKLPISAKVAGDRTLPNSTPEEPVISPPLIQSISNNGSSRLIACIDDNSVRSQALKNLLTARGYSFIAIQDALKAMLVLLNTKPDFIFINMSMPIINGYDLCSHFRKNPNFQDIPIAIFSPRDKLADRIKAKLLGATALISQPVNRQEILELIQKYLKV